MPDDREQQLTLLTALAAREEALRRDECGDWRIYGSRGHIYTWGDAASWWLFVGCHSVRHWTATKKRLDFLILKNDGDDEGAFKLEGLPTPDQAALLREVLGITKRKAYSAEDIAALKARTAAQRERWKKGDAPHR